MIRGDLNVKLDGVSHRLSVAAEDTGDDALIWLSIGDVSAGVSPVDIRDAISFVLGEPTYPRS